VGWGTHLLEQQAERERFVDLYCRAGLRAQTSMAHGSALGYFMQARALQPSSSWDSQYRVTFDLELHCAECEFLSGDLAPAEERLTALSARAVGLADRAAVTRLSIAV